MVKKSYIIAADSTAQKGFFGFTTINRAAITLHRDEVHQF